MKNEKWFLLGVSQIEKKLKTNAASGLTRKAARSRVSKNAGNLFLIPKVTIPQMLRDLFADFALLLLALSALIALVFEELRMGLTVLVLLLVDLAFIFNLTYRSHRTSESTASFFYPTARVIRSGKLFSVDYRSLVIGDVILVEAGDILCCDARLVNSDGLRVRMRVDREQSVLLDKYAEGHIRPEEYRPTEMPNMIHAGSVVERGSARAIVTAVGQYTYLGALTGGIPLPKEAEEPKAIKDYRRFSSKLSLALLCLVIPFSVSSLFFSYNNGGTVLLSSAFLTALSLVITSISHLSVFLLRIFFTQEMRKMVSYKNPAVIRSLRAMDRVAEVDYLFLLDGSLLNDGVLHYDQAMGLEGEMRNFSRTVGTRYFAEMVSLYHTAATKSLSTGISGVGNLLTGIEEFLRKSGIDRGALKYRYTIDSYAPANMITAPETMLFSDGRDRYYLYVSRLPDAVSECQETFLGSEKKRLSDEGIERLRRSVIAMISEQKIPLVFSVAKANKPYERCLVGVLALAEGVDFHWEEHMATLEKMGCQVINISMPSPSVAGIPQVIEQKGSVKKDDFLKRNLPITYRFGRFRTYLGLNDEDVATLIHHAKAQGATVAVATFSERGLALGAEADLVLSCAPIHPRTKGYLDEEMESMELSGRVYSTSCAQTVRSGASMLIPRPSFGSGGLRSLINAMRQIVAVYDRLSRFLRYLIWSQCARVMVAAIPMLLGRTLLDARHILFCGILDLFAFFSFLTIPSSKTGEGQLRYLSIRSFSDILRIDRPMLFSTLAAGLSVLLLPDLLGWIGLFGPYFYRVEFVFFAILSLNLTIHWTIRYQESDEPFFKNQWLLSEAVFVVLFLGITLISDGVGSFFGIEKNPLPYMLLSVVPSCVFVGVLRLGNRLLRKSRKKKNKKPTKM